MASRLSLVPIGGCRSPWRNPSHPNMGTDTLFQGAQEPGHCPPDRFGSGYAGLRNMRAPGDLTGLEAWVFLGNRPVRLPGQQALSYGASCMWAAH